MCLHHVCQRLVLVGDQLEVSHSFLHILVYCAFLASRVKNDNASHREDQQSTGDSENDDESGHITSGAVDSCSSAALLWGGTERASGTGGTWTPVRT